MIKIIIIILKIIIIIIIIIILVKELKTTIKNNKNINFYNEKNLKHFL